MLKILHSDYFSATYPAEWSALCKFFKPHQLITSMAQAEAGDVVLPRYRTVPFGELLEQEAQARAAQLINSFAQSEQVRNIFSWAPLLGKLTAPALTMDDLATAEEGRFFVKGQTSSLKNRGYSSVFAESKAEALALAQAIETDPWLSREIPVIRPVQAYRRLGTTRTGLPIFHERRVFTYRGKVLASGFYWSSFKEQLVEPMPPLTDAYGEAVELACSLVSSVADFLVIDMAEYVDGTWGVVELNDGCQAGISDAQEVSVYRGLAQAFAETK